MAIAFFGPAKAVREPSAADIALIQKFTGSGRVVTSADGAVFELDICNDRHRARRGSLCRDGKEL